MTNKNKVPVLNLLSQDQALDRADTYNLIFSVKLHFSNSILSLSLTGTQCARITVRRILCILWLVSSSQYKDQTRQASFLRYL